jgi:hypothetical protein
VRAALFALLVLVGGGAAQAADLATRSPLACEDVTIDADAKASARLQVDAIFFCAFGLFEDGSERYRCYYTENGVTVCGSVAEYYCPCGDAAPCLARDLPDTSGIPNCPQPRRRAISHDVTPDGGGVQ